jgi:hypothetical protein
MKSKEKGISVELHPKSKRKLEKSMAVIPYLKLKPVPLDI